MFLLVFIGVVFVLLVARNQSRAGRSRDVIEAQYLAEAGIHYADNMLKTSEEGADWRPVPDNLPPTEVDNPDFKWLRPYASVEMADGSVPNAKGPTGGFTSFRTGEGRYLLRVSYNPDPTDSMSKYIKIESIGRIGQVDNTDPTTWDDNLRLRRELTAYKPIGVTDYARFITNNEKRSADIPLGAAGFNVSYGYYKSAGDYSGAPIRVNGNLVWYGNVDGTDQEKVGVHLYLRGKTYENTSGVGPAMGNIPLDMLEVAGTIKLDEVNLGDGNRLPVPVTVHEIIDNAAPVDYQLYASDSTAPLFSTWGGFVRDGSDYPDNERQTRSIKRLEPPIIDDTDTPNKVSRYISMTRDSGIWITNSSATNSVNSGRYGWGRGVYIDNTDDRQPDSETLFGGYTAAKDWMKPNNNMSSYWQGPYYVPPGVVITLNPYDTDGDKQADITITRTDIKTRTRDSQYGRKTIWYDAAGNPMTEKGSTITIPYPQGTQTITYKNGDTEESFTIDRNGVIYAEGNVRIRGMLSKGKQLTVVSGGIIYIEGNVLKYRDSDSGEVDRTSAIALLAKDYICVNTTQFVSLLNATGPTSIGSDSGTGQPPYHLIVTPEPATTFFSSFSFGPPTGTWAPNNDVMLFVRHAGQNGPAYINMWLNKNGTAADFGLLRLGVDGPLNPFVYGVGDPRYPDAVEGTGLSSLFEHKVWWKNNGLDQTLFNRVVGYPNYLELGLDQSSYTRNNYQLSLLTVQPLDVRIEAIMYAQERSFFIIPGNWFNMNAADIQRNGQRDGVRRPRGVDPRWPFFGESLDTKITIDGAVTENLPASVADVSEWYSKWSNIPPTYGSSGEPTAHPGDGLTFVYDSMLGWPVVGGMPVRTDKYGRALPITPRLPVCQSLYYYGEPT
jgi:hypothetical protein